jgi:hypothetical protein
VLLIQLWLPECGAHEKQLFGYRLYRPQSRLHSSVPGRHNTSSHIPPEKREKKKRKKRKHKKKERKSETYIVALSQQPAARTVATPPPTTVRLVPTSWHSLPSLYCRPSILFPPILDFIQLNSLYAFKKSSHFPPPLLFIARKPSLQTQQAAIIQ